MNRRQSKANQDEIALAIDEIKNDLTSNDEQFALKVLFNHGKQFKTLATQNVRTLTAAAEFEQETLLPFLRKKQSQLATTYNAINQATQQNLKK